MFTGKDEPEREKHRVKHALANVTNQKHVRHIENQRQVLQRN